MKLKLYQVDAFTDKIFGGNPAAVVPLNKWLEDATLQNIANENNLAETAFYVKENDRFLIRWFTPTVEVDLCGHATLASAFVLFNLENYKGEVINFYSERSGVLTVTKQGEYLTLNFPADEIKKIDDFPGLTSGFNLKPKEIYQGKNDFMLIYENEKQIKSIRPDFAEVAKLKSRGVIVTAPGDNSDFVSRYFAPGSGINEDYVTGSAHTTLTPYWSKALGKNELTAIQCSSREGKLKCKYLNDRVDISGQAAAYLSGEINI